MTTSAATPRKLKGLGRGLDNLLGADRPPPTLDLSGAPLRVDGRRLAIGAVVDITDRVRAGRGDGEGA